MIVGKTEINMMVLMDRGRRREQHTYLEIQ